jgi:Plasmid pRiA4b ORF-3-like protein
MLWRRFLVRSDSTLADLHVVLQIGFDWTDFHLHRFRIRKKDYAVPRLGGLSCHDAREITLAELHFRINERFVYDYDFCDLWQHQVRIEKRLEIEAGRSYPVCVGGQWAGPPEDCGGPQAFLDRRASAPWESESCSMTYWKASKPEIVKRSITASKSCSLGKSG